MKTKQRGDGDIGLLLCIILLIVFCTMWYLVGKEDGHIEYYKGEVVCETLKDDLIYCSKV